MTHQGGHELPAPTELFARPFERPETTQMLGVIAAGYTEADIIEAGRVFGHSADGVDEALGDLPAVLPHIHQLSDALSTQNPDNVHLIAARDGELLYDDFSVTHPDVKSHLMPASIDLLLSDDMTGELGRRFLARFDLDATTIKKTDRHFTIVDTGFSGTVFVHLADIIEVLYRTSLRRSGRLDIKLVCADIHTANGPQIIDYATEEVPRDAVLLPHTAARLGGSFAHEKHSRRNSPTMLLATALQLMPRYHEAFDGLVEDGGKVMAHAADSAPTEFMLCNASNVNPIAAAIAQYRVIQSALRRQP
ncbi:MAG TPA: hypothetical protein VLG11_05690 [Candidatus Saccharimonadales bacterium]|nr:hypothetical protein [Candidatus Saccharimonadales bacterium]